MHLIFIAVTGRIATGAVEEPLTSPTQEMAATTMVQIQTLQIQTPTQMTPTRTQTVETLALTKRILRLSATRSVR
jgi:hypothetical protein